MDKSYWYCPHCRAEVDPANVTFQELHDTCGHAVEGIEGIDLDRLREICAAERDRRVVVLPCKVGDTVWKIKAAFSYYSRPMGDRVDIIIISDKEILVCCKSGTKFSTDNIDKTVFLTRPEAEAALAKEGESK